MNDRLRDMLIRHEGLRLEPYLCPAGKRTIGVGHNYDANPLPLEIAECLRNNGVITEEMAYRLLEEDVRNAESDCIRLYPGFHDFSENRRNALIDFLFNVGLATAMQFRRTNLAINSGRWDDAAAAMRASKWFTQVKGRAVEITEMIEGG